jgi:hypothetical protein
MMHVAPPNRTPFLAALKMAFTLAWVTKQYFHGLCHRSGILTFTPSGKAFMPTLRTMVPSLSSSKQPIFVLGSRLILFPMLSASCHKSSMLKLIVVGANRCFKSQNLIQKEEALCQAQERCCVHD